jgi:hypothetical protein
MTIRLPEDNFLDKILACLGKKRRVIPPDNLKELNDKFGPYSTISAKKESFWKTLFSSEEEKK